MDLPPLFPRGPDFLIFFGTLGAVFQIPLLLYDLCLYGGALLTLTAVGMMISSVIGRGEGKARKIWPALLLVGVLMLLPAALAIQYGLGESMA